MNADLFAELAKHTRSEMVLSGVPHCVECGDDWPCSTRRVGDALVRVESERDQLREAARRAYDDGIESGHADVAAILDEYEDEALSKIKDLIRGELGPEPTPPRGATPIPDGRSQRAAPEGMS